LVCDDHTPWLCPDCASAPPTSRRWACKSCQGYKSVDAETLCTVHKNPDSKGYGSDPTFHWQHCGECGMLRPRVQMCCIENVWYCRPDMLQQPVRRRNKKPRTALDEKSEALDEKLEAAFPSANRENAQILNSEGLGIGYYFDPMHKRSRCLAQVIMRSQEANKHVKVMITDDGSEVEVDFNESVPSLKDDSSDNESVSEDPLVQAAQLLPRLFPNWWKAENHALSPHIGGKAATNEQLCERWIDQIGWHPKWDAKAIAENCTRFPDFNAKMQDCMKQLTNRSGTLYKLDSRFHEVQGEVDDILKICSSAEKEAVENIVDWHIREWNALRNDATGEKSKVSGKDQVRLGCILDDIEEAITLHEGQRFKISDLQTKYAELQAAKQQKEEEARQLQEVMGQRLVLYKKAMTSIHTGFDQDIWSLALDMKEEESMPNCIFERSDYRMLLRMLYCLYIPRVKSNRHKLKQDIVALLDQAQHFADHKYKGVKGIPEDMPVPLIEGVPVNTLMWVAELCFERKSYDKVCKQFDNFGDMTKRPFSIHDFTESSTYPVCHKALILLTWIIYEINKGNRGNLKGWSNVTKEFKLPIIRVELFRLVRTHQGEERRLPYASTHRMYGMLFSTVDMEQHSSFVTDLQIKAKPPDLRDDERKVVEMGLVLSQSETDIDCCYSMTKHAERPVFHLHAPGALDNLKGLSLEKWNSIHIDVRTHVVQAILKHVGGYKRVFSTKVLTSITTAMVERTYSNLHRRFEQDGNFLRYIAALGELYDVADLDSAKLETCQFQNFESLKNSDVLLWLAGNDNKREVKCDSLCAAFKLEKIDVTANKEVTKYRILHTLLANALEAWTDSPQTQIDV